MTSRKHRPVIAAFAAATVAFGVAACSGASDGSGSSSEASNAEQSTLALGMIVPPASFEAAQANWANEAPYMQAVYDTLLEAAPDGTPGPGLATDFTWDESRTVLTLTLRDDVTFTDGTAFTADVAVQNLLRFRDGTSSNASYFTRLETAMATDEHTVVITLTEPDPAFTTYLTQNAGLQESPGAFDKDDVGTVPVGSGPYTLNVDETVAGSSYVFDRREDYWNPDHQHYERIVMNVYGNATTVLNAIVGGQVNASSLPDVTTNDQIEAAGWTLNQQLSETWNGLTLADRDGEISEPLADVRVRQAINYALDRENLVNALFNGVGTPTAQVFPPTSPSFDEALEDAYPYNPARARELLAEAGYPDGFTLSMPTVDLVAASTYDLIAAQLADVGITVQATPYGIGDIFTVILGAQYPAYYFQLQQDPTDFQIAEFLLSESSTWNPFHTADPQVEEWINVIQTGAEDEAAAAGADLNEYVVDQAWFAPFGRPTFSYASDPNTVVQMQVGGATPSIWNFRPAE